MCGQLPAVYCPFAYSLGLRPPFLLPRLALPAQKVRQLHLLLPLTDSGLFTAGGRCLIELKQTDTHTHTHIRGVERGAGGDSRMTTTEQHLQSPSDTHASTHTYFHGAALAHWASLLHSGSALHHKVKFVESPMAVRGTQSRALIKKKREKKARSAAKNPPLSLGRLVFLIYLDTGNRSSASSCSSPAAAAPPVPADVGERSKSLSLL